MIDTDKYEGHTEGPWDWFPRTNDSHIGHFERHSNLTRVTAEIKSRSAENDANAQLIADAPLLLAEVERLQSIISVFDEYMMNDFMSDMSRSEAHAIWNELVKGDGI